MKILIIGGNGFIGNHFKKFILKKGWIVDCLVLNYKKKTSTNKKLNYIFADISNYKELKKALSKNQYHYVVNFGGYVDHSNYFNGGQKVINTHFHGLENLIKVLNREKLIKFIQIGSSDEYGNTLSPQIEDQREDPFTPYSFAKVAATHFIQMLHKNENFPGVVLRFFLVYGPGQSHNRFIPHVITNCLNNLDFHMSEGNQIRDFCYISDIVEAIYLTLFDKTINGQVINIASGQPLLIKDVVKKIQNKIRYGKPEYGKIKYRKGESMSLFANTTKVNSIINWRPKISMNLGLDITIKWYKRNMIK